MSDDVTVVRVALGARSYDIQIGSGNLAELGTFVAERLRPSHAVVITDTNVAPLYTAPAKASLDSAGIRVDVALVNAGEASKSVVEANHLWEQLSDYGADRKTVVIALGGGVIGDLAGFAAATYARGLALIQVPTTLLAHVDSSVGGKVGVNLPAAKNMVGAFWQPRGVLIDCGVLQSLPEREYRAGLAEVVKYGVILDAEFFEFLEQQASALNERDPAVLKQVVARCCRLKADVVEHDETEETGLRAVLNYGHTFCHAIETVTQYGEFLHGEAVSIGMLCASRVAEYLGRVDTQFTQRQQTLLETLGLPVQVPPLNRDELLRAMQHDKKVLHGRLRFVLPTRLGHVELVEGVSEGTVRDALDG